MANEKINENEIIEFDEFNKFEDFKPDRIRPLAPYYDSLEDNYIASPDRYEYEEYMPKYMPEPEPIIRTEEYISPETTKSLEAILKKYRSPMISKLIGEAALSSFGDGIQPHNPLSSVAEVPFISPALDPQVSNREKYAKARKYRRERLHAGALGELIESIPSDPELRTSIKPFLANRSALMRGTADNGETHRDLAALFGGLMTGSEELRTRTMEALDATATEESDKLKAEAREQGGKLEADVVIVGAGIHGSILASKVRAERPDARIITIDKSAVLGGQFRKYGQRPVFYINSRNHRPQDNDVPGLPSGSGNLNPFGSSAPLHITDIAAETYPTNLELGNSAAINQYLSGETMLGAEVISISPQEKKVVVVDESGEEYEISGKTIAMATGLGERSQGGTPDNMWTAEQLLSHFANSDEPFPMEKFAGKRVAIIGGGDTGRVCAELFARLAPASAYGRSVTQLGGPDFVRWLGTEFADREEFCDTNRPRYQQLASFISGTEDSDSFTIAARSEKIFDIRYDPLNGELSVVGEDGGFYAGFDFVIDARTLPNSVGSADSILDDETFRPLFGRVRGENMQIGKASLIKQDVFLIGPAAQSALSRDEQRRFADGVKENTASIWANAPRTEAVAERIISDLELQEITNMVYSEGSRRP